MTAERIQAVLFDMDGIIFDTESLYFEVETQCLARRGLVFTPELGRRMMGLPGRDAIELLRAECQLDLSVDELLAECQTLFESKLVDRLSLMPGLLELLDRIDERGLPKAVATSTRRALAESMLGRFELPARFAFILTGDDVVAGKPNPEIYQTACRRLGLAPETVLVLEDSTNGVRAASSAGCRCVAVRHELTRTLDFPDAELIAEHLLDEGLLALGGL